MSRTHPPHRRRTDDESEVVLQLVDSAAETLPLRLNAQSARQSKPPDSPKQPQIGIVVSQRSGVLQCFRLTYFEAIARVGGIPIAIPLGMGLSPLANLCSGFILTGSENDVDPSLYGEKLIGDTTFDSVRDRLDIEILQYAENHGRPVLGICKGHQIMNVYRGGTLAQHYSEVSEGGVDHYCTGDMDYSEIHSVRLQPQTYLSSLHECAEMKVNSGHRQVIKTLGKGLRAAAISEDGLIEAIEAEYEPWRFLGVQWHPERLKHPFSTELFESFVKTCQ